MAGLLSRFFGHSAPARRTVEAVLYSGSEPLEVVGESHYQDALWRLAGGRRRDPVRQDVVAALVPEPNNAYDPNAIEVQIEGQRVGYLSREDAVRYRPGLLQLMQGGKFVALKGQIVGGGPREDGLGRLGVFLDHDPADFGLASRHSSAGGSLRTGWSEAAATDRDDDSYDLSWYGTLSSNDPTAIKQLRALLDAESDPIDRHYMLTELEARLYKSRDAFASALEEYDAVCAQHADDMSSIRPALLGKFGTLPLVDMYRQAAIRWQKAKDWERSRDWAERGLAFYGEHAARPEVVDDLHKRVAHAAAKIDAAAKPKERETRAVRTPTAAARAAAELETLTCASCGASFERERTRGRKPKLCPACRGETSPATTA